MMRLCVLCLLYSTVTSNDVNFYLKTKGKSIIQLDDLTDLTTIDRDDRVIFIIHGWTENRTTVWYAPLSDALLAKRNRAQIIQVDYPALAKDVYPIAAKNAVRVGEIVGDFIIKLLKFVPLENIEIIGHSLGGQVAGYAGSHVFKKLSRKIPLLIALDPAAPFFQGLFKIHKQVLSKQDAEIVYVLHTDKNLFGINDAVGLIDVYPNDGAAVQPGCPLPNDNLFCSHHKSYWYYISAVENPNSLIAFKCASYQQFLSNDCTDSDSFDIGGEISKANVKPGRYFLRTSANKPYVFH